MNLMQHFLMPPVIQHFELLPWVVSLLQWVFMAFSGLALGSSLVSVTLLFFGKKSFEVWARLLGSSFFNWWFLGGLPVLCFPFLYHQIWFFAEIPVEQWFGLAAITAVAGYILLGGFQKKIKPPFLMLGHVLLGVSAVSNLYLLGVLTDPGQWVAQPGQLPWIHYGSILWSAVQYFGLMALVTGSAFILFRQRKPEVLTDLDTHEQRLNDRIALVMVWLGIAIIPPALVIELFTQPSSSISFSLVQLSLLLLGILFVLSLILLRFHPKPSLTQGIFLFVLSVLATGLFVFKLSNAQATAAWDVRMKMNSNLTSNREKQTEEQSKRYKKMEASAKIGKSIFENRCSTCHSWDQKIVGPALGVVMQKYLHNPVALTKFILKPFKVNPDFPPMPNPGLNSTEVDSVTAFLVEEAKRQ